MKYFLLIMFSTVCITCSQAQQQKIVAFPLTDYMIDLNDSVRVVQVILPAGFSVKEKEAGLVKSVYNNTTADTMKEIGSGRCYLIKSNYYYFNIKAVNTKRKAAAGDLLYCLAYTPVVYDGLLWAVTRHNITLKNVYDSVLTGLSSVAAIASAAEEQVYLRRLTEDVKFTGAEMLKQGGIENVPVTTGNFKGQKILDAMQRVTEKDMKDFLRYINARPSKYAGHSWKISEIMATWMVAGCPTTIE